MRDKKMKECHNFNIQQQASYEAKTGLTPSLVLCSNHTRLSLTMWNGSCID